VCVKERERDGGAAKSDVSDRGPKKSAAVGCRPPAAVTREERKKKSQLHVGGHALRVNQGVRHVAQLGDRAAARADLGDAHGEQRAVHDQDHERQRGGVAREAVLFCFRFFGFVLVLGGLLVGFLGG
jgi:hypothetical protein